MNIEQNHKHGEEEKTPKEKGGFREKMSESFLENRQIFLWGAVTDKTAQEIVEKLLFLENQEPGEPIYFFINSPGGVISSGMAMFDVMNMITSPVYTITMGMAASMGAVLLAAGEKGHRYVFPHSKVMIHQPLISGQIVAPALDIKIHAEEIKKTRAELNKILADATGHSMEKIEQDTDRDYYLAGEEAVKYGIADAVLTDLSQVMKRRKPASISEEISTEESAPPKRVRRPKST